MKSVLGKLIEFYIKKRNPIKYAKRLGVTMGQDCSITGKVSFGSEPYLVSIGDHVQITDNVRFFTHGGGWVFRLEDPSFDTFGKIELGNNIYIGSGSMILPGVRIGNNVVIGSGSVITKSIPNNVIVAGNPARILSTFQSYQERIAKYNIGTYNFERTEKRRNILDLKEDRFIVKNYMT